MRGLFLLITALFALPVQAEMPGWWREGAVWAGEGKQDDGQRWSVEIALGPDTATVSYPSIPCAGRLDVLFTSVTTVTLRETITTGSDLCITGGTVVLRVEAGGSMLFDWGDMASGLTAKAILAPPLS
jgi:hypothetical protein